MPSLATVLGAPVGSTLDLSPRYLRDCPRSGYNLARMRREIVFAPQAAGDEKRLRANERATVRDKIKQHLRHDATKTSRSRIKRLRGLKQPQYRLRVDDIRVFYDVTEETVEILAIVPKADAAAWLERYGKPAPENELAEQNRTDKEGEKS